MIDPHKFKRKKEKVSAYEIYRCTEPVLRPVVLWCGDFVPASLPKSKKSKLLKALSGKSSGLYFFTPGKTQKIELNILNGSYLSECKKYLGQLRPVRNDFEKKFGDCAEWQSRVNSRLRFLARIIDCYSKYLQKDAECLALEEMIYFATPESARPSQWLTIDQINSNTSERLKTFRQVVLIQRGSRSSLSGGWRDFIKKSKPLAPEIIVKLIHSGVFNPSSLSSLVTFDAELVTVLLEEMRLNGQLFPESLNELPQFFSELQKFVDEPLIRSCLCRDFFSELLHDETVCRLKDGAFLTDFSLLNEWANDFLADHLKKQGFNFSVESSSMFDVIHWFTGIKKNKLKSSVAAPVYFSNLKVKLNYEHSLQKKCLNLIPKITTENFGRLALNYIEMLKKEFPAAALLKIVSRCREFCPPGTKGQDAVNLSNFVFEKIKDCNSGFIEWLSDNTVEVLTLSHNKAEGESFKSPNFENIKQTLESILSMLPWFYESGLTRRFFDEPEIFEAITYIYPSKFCLKWIQEQDDDWFQSAIKSRFYWYHIMTMKESSASQVLAWGTELRKEGMSWEDIAEILYKVEDLRVDKNEKDILRHLSYFREAHTFSQEMKLLVEKIHGVENADLYGDITDFFEYVDKVKNGWQNVRELWELFKSFIIERIKTCPKKEYSLYQEYYKIHWVACFEVESVRTVEILKIIPSYHDSAYEATLMPLNWLAKHHKQVFSFVDSYLKDRDSFNRIIYLLKMLKISCRLNQNSINHMLKEWTSFEQTEMLDELKYYRGLAKYDTDLPGNIRKIISLPEKLQREKESLTVLKAEGRISASALQRLEKVEEWLNKKKRLKENIENDLQKSLPEAIANARMDSLVEISCQLCKDHWNKISSRPVEKWDDDWRNALQLSFLTTSNKRILRKLMHNAVNNDFQWIYYHSENIAFLNGLPDSFDRDQWLSPLSIKFNIGKKVYTVEVERNLLKILQMGNYFGSCLSVGAMNGFSTVANAVEINKHVLWIKNSSGKIVGRKLLVINHSGDVYGFHSYGAALNTENENPWYKIMFDLYSLELAKACNGKISNKRKEEDEIILFADWYDDGIERFDGWVMELQKGSDNPIISRKVKYKTKHGVNLRAALWLKTRGADIVAGWDSVKPFQDFAVENFKMTVKHS